MREEMIQTNGKLSRMDDVACDSACAAQLNNAKSRACMRYIHVISEWLLESFLFAASILVDQESSRTKVLRA